MMMIHNLNRRFSANRRKTHVDALIDLDGSPVPVVIRDVSYSGMKLSAPVDLETGTALSIRFLDQNVPAIVHWSRMGHIGVHLLQRLDRDTLVALESSDDDLAEYR